MAADLHVHTTFSDSTWPPHKVIEACRAERVGTVAITDHDAVGGIEPALDAARSLGVRVIPGVELTVYENEKEIHVVGLFIDYADPAFNEVIREKRDARRVRAQKMVRILRGLNIPITEEQVFRIAGEGAPGRVHVAQALVECGQVSSISEAFHLYIGTGGPACVPKHQLGAAEAAQAVHAAGGVSIVAHPGAGLDESLVRRMIAEGIDGLEAWHPLHSPEQSRHFLELAAELGVLVSGGTDCHGDVNEGVRIGGVVIDDACVDRIEERANEVRRQNRQDRSRTAASSGAGGI